jgi:hypothetical protein
VTITLDKRGKLHLSEAAIQKQCVEFLRAENWIVRPAPREGYKASRGAHRVPAGEPDLIAVRYVYQWGWQVLMIEVKDSKGKLSEAQFQWWKKQPFPLSLVRSLDDLRTIVPLPSIRLRAAGSGA